jgi:LPS export ABC transporter protein LptC
VNRSQKGILGLAAVAAAASLWLQLHASHNGPAHPATAALPDLYIEQPHWDRFDPEGRIATQLQASRAEQWPGEQHTRLVEPQLEIRDLHQRHWQLQAGRGRLSADGGPLLLEQQVVLRRETGSDGPVLTTERLNIAADGDLVETDAPVVLRSGNWHFSAGGLRAELDRESIELFNQVRGIHE